MEVHNVVKNRCKGCGICVAACPKKALAFSNEMNNSGYHFVVNDKEKCVRCGICYTVCPDMACEIIEGEV